MLQSYLPVIEAAPRGERGRMIEDLSRQLGVSKATIYRKLDEAGYCQDRQRRADAGSTTVEEQALAALAAYMKSGIRSNDKATLAIPTARQVLEASGVDFGEVTNSTLGRLLRERGLDVKTQQAPEPFVRMRSLHPNHVHQCDPSVCLVYYLPNGGQHILEEREVYKNKPFLLGKENLKVWRYVLTDHYSGSICHRYYQVAGENTLTLWDFLLYSWAKKADPLDAFHGLPDLLVWDKGSANSSKAIANALRGLRVQTYDHKVGNPRAKGSVERSNDIVERLFESRLKAQPVRSVDELNEYAEKWDALYNAGLIKGYDSTLRRAKSSRLDLWLTIPVDKLRELPEGARNLLVPEPETRQVQGDLSVSYAHPRLGRSGSYSLGKLPGIRPKLVVNVQPILTDPDGVLRVSYQYQGEEITDEIYPALIDEAGFPLDAPVWGQEFKSHPDTYVQTAAKSLDDLIGDEKKPFAGWNEGNGIAALDAIQSSDPSVVAMQKTGRPVAPPQSRIRISTVEAAKVLKARMGWWTPECLQYLRETYTDGVPEADFDAIELRLGGQRRKAGCVG